MGLKRRLKKILKSAGKKIAEEGGIEEFEREKGRGSVEKRFEKVKEIKPRKVVIEKAEKVVTQKVETPKVIKKEVKKEEKPIEKPIIVEFPRATEELQAAGIIKIEKMKGGIAGMPKLLEIPKEVASEKISSEWRPPKLKELEEKYALIEPYAYALIKWDEKEDTLKYIVLEPPLSKEEEDKLKRIEDFLVDLLDISLSSVRNIEQVKEYLEQKLKEIIRDYEIAVTEAEYYKILYYIQRDFLGLEKIEPLMHDPMIEDISCDGVKVPVFVFHRKYGSLKTNIVYDSLDELNRFITKLAQRCGKHISVAEPLLDAALPDGSRLQATFSSGKDIAMRGSTFTIRKFTKDPLTIIDIINFGTLPPLIAAYLWMAIEFRNSLLVAGGTATGKTSMLNALSLFIKPEYKIVSIEDTPELRLPHEHWIAKVARVGFGPEDIRGKRRGEVSMFDLLKAALRERPDYIIVGEVRGEEAYVLFQGMATGHPGLATIHAESIEAVINRLRTPPINLPPGLLQHLNLVLILSFGRIKGIDVRRLKELVEIVGVDIKSGKPITNTLFRWVPAGDYFEFASDRSYVLNKIIEEKGISEESVWAELRRRMEVINWMRKKKIRYYKDVGKIIAQYYRDPESVMKMVREE